MAQGVISCLWNMTSEGTYEANNSFLGYLSLWKPEGSSWERVRKHISGGVSLTAFPKITYKAKHVKRVMPFDQHHVHIFKMDLNIILHKLYT